MARRKKKRIIDKKWVPVYFDNCPRCDSPPEINTLCKKDDAYYHLDEVRCSALCGATGAFNIEEGQFVGSIIWNETE